MLKTILELPRFAKDYKRLIKKGLNQKAFREALEFLMQENKEVLTTRYHDHALKGEWHGYRELHIKQNLLLIYRVNRDELQLVLVRIGSHDALF